MKKSILCASIACCLTAVANPAFASDARMGRENGGHERNKVVHVQFNNYGDGVARSSVDSILKEIGAGIATLHVEQYRKHEWGTAGEFSICADFTTNEDAQSMLESFSLAASEANRNSSYPLVDVRTDIECRETTLNPITYRGKDVSELLLGRWSVSGEVDGSEATVYRHEVFKLPPSRGREQIEFKPEGQLTQTRMGANDRSSNVVPGVWRLRTASRVETKVNGRVQIYDIVSINDTLLVLRPLADSAQ